ncbi:hypothetical protein SARC_06454 [Sphaeroforma arctica JP610]|uniref:Uncharacterized protein n=1 Tax=Sphaeroforma arctica JP610 TaxID=667725 RepID=A0A0L0FWL3_9EUKA|nr:hypothetical protein SARC_06454 [Sphaeroforma arctica JP610]KNC81207.1 hypothetical protein SARC_06454 [Sphaeroforma arctica JP610]|eukprot:XP_014155109.1 hypothetical protein SARC_06454 [Sphaeroforma arctica JP610]
MFSTCLEGNAREAFIIIFTGMGGYAVLSNMIGLRMRTVIRTRGGRKAVTTERKRRSTTGMHEIARYCPTGRLVEGTVIAAVIGVAMTDPDPEVGVTSVMVTTIGEDSNLRLEVARCLKVTSATRVGVPTTGVMEKEGLKQVKIPREGLKAYDGSLKLSPMYGVKTCISIELFNTDTDQLCSFQTDEILYYVLEVVPMGKEATLGFITQRDNHFFLG